MKKVLSPILLKNIRSRPDTKHGNWLGTAVQMNRTQQNTSCNTCFNKQHPFPTCLKASSNAMKKVLSPISLKKIRSRPDTNPSVNWLSPTKPAYQTARLCDGWLFLDLLDCMPIAGYLYDEPLKWLLLLQAGCMDDAKYMQSCWFLQAFCMQRLLLFCRLHYAAVTVLSAGSMNAESISVCCPFAG